LDSGVLETYVIKIHFCEIGRNVLIYLDFVQM